MKKRREEYKGRRRKNEETEGKKETGNRKEKNIRREKEGRHVKKRRANLRKQALWKCPVGCVYTVREKTK